MSVNRYDASTGELINIASGQRTWVGTQAAYKAAKQAGTLPNNAIIAITDDEVDHNHYSTDEVETGMYWIDGRPIYRKVVDCGALPNNTTKSVPHGISNLDWVVELKGTAIYSNGGTYLLLPNSHPVNVGSSVQLYATDANINLRTGSDLSSYTNTKVIIEYTKTTD